MARQVLLFTGPWSDRPLDELATRAGEWGYAGVELCCWGDHFEVQRALAEDDYGPARLDLLSRADLGVAVLSNHRVGQAVSDVIDQRHRALVPDYVWGDGEPSGVRQRAAEEMMATVRAAEKIGVSVVAGFTGSPVWSYVAGWPSPSPDVIAEGFRELAAQWQPILDVCAECGVRFAAEVHPGQAAFDLYSAELLLEALEHRPEFGFTFDPSHFHWQGVDPAEFVHRFGERVYHVHLKDASLTLDGRAGVLSGYWPSGDRRRGWQFRSPGRGGVEWESVIRALNRAGYQGPLSVDWHDPDMDRDFGAEDTCRFARQLDFEPRSDATS